MQQGDWRKRQNNTNCSLKLKREKCRESRLIEWTEIKRDYHQHTSFEINDKTVFPKVKPRTETCTPQTENSDEEKIMSWQDASFLLILFNIL